MPTALRLTDQDLATLSRKHLEAIVAIDSQSDERSDSIPSTEGQRRLSEWLDGFFAGVGCRVERDAEANLIATLPGRGAGATRPPVALMVHLDTSRGTRAVPALMLEERWNGRRVPYAENQGLWVDVETYPAAAEFVGQDLLFGPGDAPFGLDDKLGLTHLMTLASLLQRHPTIAHPPLLFIARPDEEIGRMAAVEGLARELETRRVPFGFTVDGILPFEVNVENFNASQGSIVFPSRPIGGSSSSDWQITVFIGGVNTHGCTAKAEGFRAATRLAAELLAELRSSGNYPAAVVPIAFASMPLRDCDAEMSFLLRGDSMTEIETGAQAVHRALEKVMEPHLKRGASWRVDPIGRYRGEIQTDGAVGDALLFVERFLASDPGFVLAAEESEGREGYSNPYRILPVDGGVKLDVRMRDFDPEGLRRREGHLQQAATSVGLEARVAQQYVNMGPRLASHPELVELPRRAAAAIGLDCRVLPIRGGTGVDPFLDRGIPIANLGTGYFAPESEKEFTSLQMMVGHARWLASLVEILAEG